MKEIYIEQNRRYIEELCSSLQKGLKDSLRKELKGNDTDEMVRILIDPSYWFNFGVKESKHNDLYLEGLSKKAVSFIQTREEEGRANLYIRIESYLKAQMSVHRLDSLEKAQQMFFSKHKVKYDLHQKDKEIIDEIVALVYKRLQEK